MTDEKAHKSWDELYTQLYGPLSGLLRRLGIAANDIADVIQIMFIKAMKSHPDADTVTYPYSYMASVANTVAADFHKANKGNVGDPEGLGEKDKKALARQAITDRRRERILEGLRDGFKAATNYLNRDEKKLMALKLEERSWQEIAATLGITIEDAKKRWARIRAKLIYRVRKETAKLQA